MTGAAIVRWEAGRTVVLAVHGAFDGASAWALRLEMDESPAREFEIDLTHAVEACDFAACLVAGWARRWGRLKRVRFRPGSAGQARILAAHGLELADAADPSGPTLAGFPIAAPMSGASA
ncbi:MAG TPA: hypothetical protein VFL83_19530 [Anaeromyxobacter sp.]|nr:hypothetical protein [Anaeromyxobacter sp.]